MYAYIYNGLYAWCLQFHCASPNANLPRPNPAQRCAFCPKAWNSPPKMGYAVFSSARNAPRYAARCAAVYVLRVIVGGRHNRDNPLRIAGVGPKFGVMPIPSQQRVDQPRPTHRQLLRRRTHVEGRMARELDQETKRYLSQVEVTEVAKAAGGRRPERESNCSRMLLFRADNPKGRRIPGVFLHRRAERGRSRRGPQRIGGVGGRGTGDMTPRSGSPRARRTYAGAHAAARAGTPAAWVDFHRSALKEGTE